jgi:hypothetical protein
MAFWVLIPRRILDGYNPEYDGSTYTRNVDILQLKHTM